MEPPEHLRPVLGGVGVGEVGPHGGHAVPDSPDERVAGGVLDEDVHLDSAVVGRVAARRLAARHSRIDDRYVVHAVLKRVTYIF